MQTAHDINQAIMFGQWSNDELTSMMDAIRWNRASLTKQVKRSITVGSDVKFHSAKRGMTVQGRVTKIAVKYATVSTTNGLWKVPMNMLETV